VPSHFCGAQNCTQYPRGGRANAGYSGMINSFDQRVLLCLICQSWSAIFLLTYTVCHGQERAASLGPSLCTTGIFPILRAVLDLERRTAGSVTHLGLLFLLPCLGFLSCQSRECPTFAFFCLVGPHSPLRSLVFSFCWLGFPSKNLATLSIQ